MSKKILLHILLSVLSGTLLMFMGMFVSMEVDMTKWTEVGRAILVWAWLIATAFIGMGIGYSHEQDHR